MRTGELYRIYCRSLFFIFHFWTLKYITLHTRKPNLHYNLRYKKSRCVVFLFRSVVYQLLQFFSLHMRNIWEDVFMLYWKYVWSSVVNRKIMNNDSLVKLHYFQLTFLENSMFKKQKKSIKVLFLVQADNLLHYPGWRSSWNWIMLYLTTTMECNSFQI